MEEELCFDLVFSYGVCWRFLLMVGICVKVEIIDLLPEFGFVVMFDPNSHGATFVKKKVEKKKIEICCGSRGDGLIGLGP